MDFDIKELLRQHKRLVYAVIALVSVLYVEGQVSGFVSDLDVCASDRFKIQTEQTTLWQTHRSLSLLVFRGSVVSCFLFLGLLVSLGEDKTNSAQFYVPRFQWHWNTAFGAAFTVLWYGSSYALLLVLKVLLGDTACSGGDPKSNSVSGHFSFFFFYAFALPYLALVLLPYDNARFSTRNILSPKSPFHFKLTLLALCYAFFLCGGLFTLSQTWSWGYHSTRQILYGIAFGLGSHLVLRSLFKDSSSLSARTLTLPDHLPANADEFQALVSNFYPVSYLALFSATSTILAILFTFGLPFNFYELVGFFVLWPTLLYAFVSVLRGQFSSHCTLD